MLKLSFFSGLSTLIYGNFLLLLPTIIFCYLYAIKKQGKWNVKQVLVKTGLLSTVFFLPSVAWMLLLYSFGVHFFSSEIATLRQFVWITDELARSDFFSFIAAFYENTLEFVTTFGSILFTTVFLLITVLLVKETM